MRHPCLPLTIALALLASACRSEEPLPSAAGQAADGEGEGAGDGDGAGDGAADGASDGAADGDDPPDGSCHEDRSSNCRGQGDGEPTLNPLAKNLALVIDSVDDVDFGPIISQYVVEVEATEAGDKIIALQKYFHSGRLIRAMVDAAKRGVEVTGIYGDDLEPTCESVLGEDEVFDCGSIFIRGTGTHHKNMMVLRGSTVHGLVGSHNVSESSDRRHTVLDFDVEYGTALFDFYAGERDRLLSVDTDAPNQVVVPVEGGGTLTFTAHPGPSNPPKDLLEQLDGCESTLWVSYFAALPDSTGLPVFNELQRLKNAGCDVRVLLDPDNQLAKLSLAAKGVPTEYPSQSEIGHKIVSVVSGGETYLLQSSANLVLVNHNLNHNLTVSVRVPSTALHQVIEAELLNYWPE